MRNFLCSEEVTQRQLNKIRDVVNHERLDEELYHDHETEEARKVGVTQVPIIVQIPESLSDCASVGMQKRTLKESKDRERLKKQLEKVCMNCCKCLLFVTATFGLMHWLLQKGESEDGIESKLKDIETKNAAAASKTVKTFYTVTVKVEVYMWLSGHLLCCHL